VKKILLREANAEGHRCVKKETAAFCQSRHTTVIHNTLSTKEEEEKKTLPVRKKVVSFVYNRNNKHGELMGIHVMH